MLPYLVVFWGIGVLGLSVRLLGGLWYLRKLRTSLTKPVSTMLMSQLHSVSERLGLARSVQLRESLAVTVPLVVGWLRPMILLPSSVITGLSVRQLEMILAHELAHIRRHDYLVNLLQSVIETLLFYHPAVWWVSARIRHEREHCCDDLAVKVCGGDKRSYAQALADLDDLRPKMQFVQAASGGSLLKRILRLADKALPKALEPRQWLAGLSMIAVSVVMFIVLGISLTIAQGDAITLRLAVSDQQGRPTESYVLEFVEQVETLSDGEITIEPTWEAGADTTPTFEQGVAEALVEGRYDLGLAASRAWGSVGVTSFQPLQAPFLIDNDALAEAVATSPTATAMLEGLSSVGVVGLTMWLEELRHPFAFDSFGAEPFLSPEDFAGTTIRIIGSGTTSALIEALGATPIVKEDWGQDVADGLIQGTEAGLLGALGLPAPGTITGNVTFYPKFQVLVANSAAFERLSDEQRSILREAALEAQEKAISERASEADAGAYLCTNGGKIVFASEDQLAAFEEAAQPVFDQIAQNPTNAEFIAAIRDLKANTPASPGAAACTSTAPDATYRGALPPNGVYRIDITNAEELMALGARPGFANSNVGSTTWAFKDGTMTMHWESGNQSDDCTWTYGSTGDVLRLELPISECSDIPVVLELLWREHADGALEFLLLSTTDPTIQALVDTRALFERTWQRIEEVWSEGLPPNGTWQVELTQEDIIGQGVLQSRSLDWAGVHTWTFQDGKATYHFQGQDESFGCEATHQVVEDVVRVTYTSGSDCEGEVDDIQWRLEDDGLNLHLIDITGAPFVENKAYLEAKPWRKIE